MEVKNNGKFKENSNFCPWNSDGFRSYTCLRSKS